MPDIQITIKGYKKKGKKTSDPTPEVWPTLLKDEDTPLKTTTFSFFDGWTVPLDLDIVSASGSEVSVAGEQTRHFDQGNSVIIYYLDDDNNEQSTDAIVSDTATYSGNATTIPVSLAIPNNSHSIRAWIDCPDLTGALGSVASSSVSLGGNIALLDPYNTSITCHSQSDSKVPVATIEREYSESNEDRWERKPLGEIDTSDENEENKTWDLGNRGFYNVLLELKTAQDDEDAKKGDASSITDNESDFKSELTDNSSLAYKTKKGCGGTAIAVTECGSGSRGTYVADVMRVIEGETTPEGDPLYAEVGIGVHKERLTLDGLYFMPFDCSDTTNYKVTKEPSFGSEEVDGYFVQNKHKYDIFMMPRRTAFYCRTRQHTSNPIISLSAPIDFYIYTDDEGEHTVFTSHCSAYLYTLVPLTEHIWVVDNPNPWWEHYCQYSLSFNDPYGILETQEAIGGWIYGMSISVQGIGSTINVGLWWDRIPNNFSVGTGDGFTKAGQYYYPDYPDVQYPRAIGATFEKDESLEDVNIYNPEAFSGKNNISFASSISYKYGWVILGTDGIQPLKNIPISVWQNGPGLMFEGPFWGEAPDSSAVGKIWRKIAGVVADPSDPDDWKPQVGCSTFWQNYGLHTFSDSSAPLSMWDNIPYGLAASPSMAEELCGIVKDSKTDECWFIWRKTDEEMDLEKVDFEIPEGYEGEGIYKDYNGHHASFESVANGNVKETNVNEFTIARRDFDGNIVMGGVDRGECFATDGFYFVDQFSGPKTRLKTHMGRAIDDEIAETGAYPVVPPVPPQTVGDPGCPATWTYPYLRLGMGVAGQCVHELAAPIVVLFCKERATRETIYKPGEWPQGFGWKTPPNIIVCRTPFANQFNSISPTPEYRNGERNILGG
jgi:hypothetical protein